MLSRYSASSGRFDVPSVTFFLVGEVSPPVPPFKALVFETDFPEIYGFFNTGIHVEAGSLPLI